MLDLAEHGLLAPATPPRHIGGPGTIDRLLDAPTRDDPGQVALVGRHERLTMSELEESSCRAANTLRALGVQPGDRVAASLPNQTDIVVAFLGAMRAGAIWLGINRSLAPPEKAYMLRDAQASVLLADPETSKAHRIDRSDLPELRHIVTIEPDSPRDEWRARLAHADAERPALELEPLTPAAIAYTSGTTGFPKGAVHTHHNLLLPGAVGTARGLHSEGGVLGVALPLTVLNLVVLGPLVAYQAGLRLVTMDRVDGLGMAEWIRDEAITTFAAVPAMVHDLLTNPAVSNEMLTSITSIGVGGADMPDAFRDLYEERFGVPVGTGYGLTEAPTAVTVEDVTEPLVPNSCGKALPQCRIVVVDGADQPVPPGTVGEVCVGPATDGPFADCYRPMLGYWNQPAESAEALRGELLHTADLGELDGDGNLFIKDRKHDLIIRGGANVYPAEVERVLHDDKRVAACAVIGVPDERLGERVAAFVQLAPGETATADELEVHCTGQLAAYKVPDTITFVADFARTPMGKIRKTDLRADQR